MFFSFFRLLRNFNRRFFDIQFENLLVGIMEPHINNGLHITTDTTGEQNAMNNQENDHENGNL